jgi:hypothetical protein
MFGDGAVEDDVLLDAHPDAAIAATANEKEERRFTRESGIGNRNRRETGADG